MGRNKKAAIATCARAALSSINTTGPMSLVTIRNGVSLASSVREAKRAALRRQYCGSSSCAGAGGDANRQRCIRHDRDRIIPKARITACSQGQPAPGMLNATSDCVDNMAHLHRNGAPHSLSAPVGQGRRQAEGYCGRLMFKQVVAKLAPIRAIQKKPGRSSAPRQSYRQFNRQVTGLCDGLMKQRVVGGLVPTSTCCEQGDEA